MGFCTILICSCCSSGKATEGVPRADASEDDDEEDLSLRSALERISIGDDDQQDAVPWQPGTAWGGGVGGVGGVGSGGEGAGQGENQSGGGLGDMAHEKGDMCVAYSTVSGRRK